MKRFSNDLLNELSNEYANKWVKAEALDWRSLRRAYRSGFLTAAKILNGEIRESCVEFCQQCENKGYYYVGFPGNRTMKNCNCKQNSQERTE